VRLEQQVQLGQPERQAQQVPTALPVQQDQQVRQVLRVPQAATEPRGYRVQRHQPVDKACLMIFSSTHLTVRFTRKLLLQHGHRRVALKALPVQLVPQVLPEAMVQQAQQGQQVRQVRLEPQDQQVLMVQME
jgi:hypothetical protein